MSINCTDYHNGSNGVCEQIDEITSHIDTTSNVLEIQTLEGY